MMWIIGAFGHIRRIAFAGLVSVLATLYFAGPIVPVIGPPLERRVEANFTDAVRRSLAETDGYGSASRVVIKQHSVLSQPGAAPAPAQAASCALLGAVQMDRFSQRTDWRLYTAMLSVIAWMQGNPRFDRAGFEHAVDEVNGVRCNAG